MSRIFAAELFALQIAIVNVNQVRFLKNGLMAHFCQITTDLNGSFASFGMF